MRDPDAQGNIIENIVNTLYDGAYFGEVALVASEKRVATVRAQIFCDLFVLSREDLFTVMNDHEEALRKIISVAEQRVNDTKQFMSAVARMQGRQNQTAVMEKNAN